MSEDTRGVPAGARRKFQKYDDVEDYDPHQYRNIPHPTSNVETLIHILKGCLGTGIISMPQAFQHIGSVFGIISTVVIGIICTYSIHLLINTIYLISKLTKTPQLTYSEAMRAACQIGPPRFKKMSSFGGVLVDVFLIAFQLGICAVYIVFTVVNTKDVMDDYIKLHLFVYSAIYFIPFGLNILLRDLKIMYPVSLVTTVLTFISFGICLYYIFTDIPSFTSRPMFKSIKELPFFIGITLFAIQAIGVIISAENNMETPKSFTKPLGVFNIAQILIVSLYTGIGLAGYWKYGEDTRPSVTLNIPKSELPSQIARLLYVISIYGSYSLQALPIIEIMWNNYMAKHVKASHAIRYEYLLRFGIVIITYIFATVVPLLSLVIALVGCLCLSALALVFAPIMESLVKYPDQLGRCNWILIKNIMLIILGTIFLTIGTYCTIYKIVIELHEKGYDQ